MNIFNEKWILSQNFIKQEDDEDGNLTFSKKLEETDFWVYLPKYFPDLKSQYLLLWWKNTSLKIKSEYEYKKFQTHIQISDCELPRNGPIELKKTVLGLFDSINNKYKIELIELKIINYNNLSFEKNKINCYNIKSTLKKEKIFVWFSIDNINFEWKEIIFVEKFGYVFKPFDEIEELKLKIIKYENLEFENLFENSFIGIFSNLEIFNSSKWKYQINNQIKIGTVIYRKELAQFSITDENTNLKYAISAVKFLEKIS
jgi:hypothetical protein